MKKPVSWVDGEQVMKLYFNKNKNVYKVFFIHTAIYDPASVLKIFEDRYSEYSNRSTNPEKQLASSNKDKLAYVYVFSFCKTNVCSGNKIKVNIIFYRWKTLP